MEETQGDAGVLEAPSELKRNKGSTSLVFSPTFDRVRDQWEESGNNLYAGTSAQRSWKSLDWNGKRGITVDKAMKESCGIWSVIVKAR